MAISIHYQGDKKVFKILDAMADPAERKRLMDAIGAYGVSSTQQRFLDQQAADGTKWKPSRRAMATGGQTLRRSARLFSSLTFQATAASVAWGTNVLYASTHQFGATIRAKAGGKLKFRGLNGNAVFVDQVTLPARPFLGISALDTQRIEQIAGDWMGGLAR